MAYEQKITGSIAMLPDPATMLPTQNVAEAKRLMLEAQRVLGTLPQGQTVYGRGAYTAAGTALASIDAFLRNGGAIGALSTQVPGYIDARKDYLRQLTLMKGGDPAAAAKAVEPDPLDQFKVVSKKETAVTLGAALIVAGSLWLMR